MKGGDGSGGRAAFPPSYYGNGLGGYFEAGSKELIDPSGKQLAVSQGTISSNGTMAGPNLFPMIGGDCGCKKQRKSKNSHKKSKNSNKKSKNSRKHK